MTTVYGWTGREAMLLRKALRLSVRDFAARLGVGARTVNKWEARRAGITPLPYMQEVLDTALAQSADEVKARFAAAVHADVPVSGSPEGGVLVPVVVDGRLVLVPFDAHAGGPFAGSGVTVSAPDAAVGKVASWVDRRDFGQHVAGVVFGVAGMAGLDVGRLLSLLPQAEPVGTRRIGAADVEAIEQITAAFRRQDFAHGSGAIRDAAVAQLRSALPLLGAQVSPEVRSRLLIATARLAMMTGWMSFQVRQHDAARRLWLVGLDVARDARTAGHPLASDLTGYLVYDMALQALHLERPKEALRLVQIGQDALSASPVLAAATDSCLKSIGARGHAALGDAAACDRALGQAEEQFSRIDPATQPPWGAHLNDAAIASHRGGAHYELARINKDQSAADQAVAQLRYAVDHWGADYALLEAQDLPRLAGAHALAGDCDTAVTIGHQAVDAITSLTSPRAYDHLRTLDTVLTPLHTSSGVADLRARLATTTA